MLVFVSKRSLSLSLSLSLSRARYVKVVERQRQPHVLRERGVLRARPGLAVAVGAQDDLWVAKKQLLFVGFFVVVALPDSINRDYDRELGLGLQ